MGDWKEVADLFRERDAGACPRPARFLRVHSGGLGWSPSEKAHLEQCQRCQAYEAEVIEQFVRPIEARQYLLAELVFRRMVRLVASKEHSGELADIPRQDLETTDDKLTASVSLSEGEHWLDLEHESLPVGSLVRVEVRSSGDEPPCVRYLVLREGRPRTGGQRHSVARSCLEELLGTSDEMALGIAPVERVFPGEGRALAESFDSVSRDDPASNSTWREWAERQRLDNDLTEDVLEALDGIVDHPFPKGMN